MQNSRLPISTSVRRPTSIAKGSTSFVGINRPSAIPTTLRKYANELFTPQTKTPRPSYNASTAGKSYRPGVATEKKYKKPLPEREELQQMFDTLVEYIKTNAPNLPLPEPKKFFLSVSTTESSRIFQLLIGRLIPDKKIARLETDVPEALASLDYPYVRSVTKSSLVSVASRTAAISLLVIFDWLIKQIQELEHIEPPDCTEHAPDVEWNEVCKIKLLQPEVGRDAFQEPFERLYPTDDIEALMRDHEMLTEEHEKLALDSEEIQDSLQELQTLEEDIIKCNEYKVQMEKYSDCKLKEFEETSNQRSRIRFQKDEVIRRTERGQLDIKNHELIVDEVMRDQAEIQRLEADRLELRNQISEISEKYEQWRMKNQGSSRDRIQDNIEEKVSQIKRLLEEYESLDYPNSSTLAERKLEFSEWIMRMKKLSPSDIALVQRAFHDFSLYIQKLQATDSRLRSEIWDHLSSEKSALNEVSRLNTNYEKVLVPRLEEALKRKEHEKRIEEMQIMDTDAKFNAHREEKLRQFSNGQENVSKEMIELERQLEQDRRRLEAESRDSGQDEELRKQHLKVVLESHEQEKTNLKKDLDREVQQWTEALRVAEANKQIVMAAHKKLKHKLNPHRFQEP